MNKQGLYGDIQGADIVRPLLFYLNLSLGLHTLSLDMDDLYKEFCRFITEQDLLVSDEKIFVAYSGGQDSSALLLLMKRASKDMGFELKACYFNHRLRGKESDLEEEFIKRTTEQWNVDLVCGEGDVYTFARDNKFSVEEAARILRYRFFEESLLNYGFDKVATGHQADDHIETILSNFLRGTSIKGLSGIPVKRLPYIRPLIFASRKRLLTYLKDNSTPFFTDSTNLKDDYFRNNIRLNLVPYLEENFNKQVKHILNKYGKCFSEADDYLSKEAQKRLEKAVISEDKNKIKLDILKFNGYFNIIKKYILSDIFYRLGLEEKGINSPLVETLIGFIKTKKSKKQMDLSGTVSFYMDYPTGFFYTRLNEDFEYQVTIGEKIVSHDFGFEFSSRKLETTADEGDWEEIVDLDRLREPLCLRNRKKGDRFVPLGMTKEKKLSDFFIDEKIPAFERKKIPLLLSDNKIIWVCGHRISNEVKVTENTGNKLGLHFKLL